MVVNSRFNDCGKVASLESMVLVRCTTLLGLVVGTSCIVTDFTSEVKLAKLSLTWLKLTSVFRRKHGS